MVKQKRVNEKAATAQSIAQRRLATMKELGKIAKALQLDDTEFAEQLGVECEELEAWQQGRGRPQMRHIINLQPAVIAFNDALGSAVRIDREGIDLSRIRGLVADMDRKDGVSPYQGSKAAARTR